MGLGWKVCSVVERRRCLRGIGRFEVANYISAVEDRSSGLRRLQLTERASTGRTIVFLFILGYRLRIQVDAWPRLNVSQ